MDRSHSFDWSGIRLLSFDTFGTLIDWERGLLAAAPAFADIDDDVLLAAFGDLELAVQSEQPTLTYRTVLGVVYDRLCERFAIDPSSEQRRHFKDSVPAWPPFDDTRDALDYLRQHFFIVTLTNCDRASYAGAISQLRVDWDAVYTAEDIGSYKPNLRNFQHLLESVRRDFRVLPSELLHVAQSLTHDHVPATTMGLKNCWVDRRGNRGGGATAAPRGNYELAMTVPSMAALVEEHRRWRKAT
ncbi:MAG: HAD family hydrolase [Pseudomonadota bacterium]